MREAAGHARELLRQHGPQEVWHAALSGLIDAQLVADLKEWGHWTAVVREVGLMVLRPGGGDIEIRRSAKSLISLHGYKGGWEKAMEQANELEDKLVAQTVMLRIADAVLELKQEAQGKSGQASN